MTAAKCKQPGCTGHIGSDGYCDTCGTKAAPGASKAAPAKAGALAKAAAPAPSTSSVRSSTGTLVSGSARSHGARRTTSARTSRRSRVGAGIVSVPPMPEVDPRSVVIKNPTVAEDKRFCSNCGAPVGRAKGDTKGRLAGFCPKCRHAFDFVPKLKRGDLVGGQYEVVGCLAHGGLGWIYLAVDKAVNDRWVVLKGLLDAGDAAAMNVALAERAFLAQIEHPNIVGILNFVTHEKASYIVEEYVGGRSLKQLLQDRRDKNGGEPDPLPVDQALAFVFAILPAFSYLHDRGLVYCDFKPDNLVQVGDDVKLIDMGAVRRLDDPSGDVYGTVGYQAPEIADMGPSISSDLYTVGRALAVLTLNFRGFTTTFEYTLPAPADHPLLAEYDSFHRLLLKATAKHPDDRFQSASEFSDQLVGVMREVVARTTSTPEPALSAVFGVPPDDGSLPPLAVDTSDDAAVFLANLNTTDPRITIDEIDSAVAAKQVAKTKELRLRRARALGDAGDVAASRKELDDIEAGDPWEWRVDWLRGGFSLADGDLAAAGASFERCRAEVPGELAPKLAAALVEERANDRPGAAHLFDIVSTVDPSYVAAAMGLARCLATDGNVDGALAAHARIPETHRAFARAQRESVRILFNAERFDDAIALLRKLDVDELQRAQLQVELMTRAVTAADDRASKATLDGAVLTDRGARLGLEKSLRELAEQTSEEVDRFTLIDRANRARPITLW